MEKVDNLHELMIASEWPTPAHPEWAPFLVEQIKRPLEKIGGKPVRCFAYPGGKYTSQIIDVVKACGFSTACAETPLNLGVPRFELPCTGIYSPSFVKFIIKLNGVHKIASFKNRRQNR